MTASLRLVVLAWLLLLGPAAMPAVGQDPTPTPTPTSSIRDDQVFDPDLEQEVQESQPGGESSTDPIDPEEAPTVDEGDEEITSEEAIQQPGWGSAADQPAEAKRIEAENDCKGDPPPTSQMLGLPGSIAGDKGDSLGWLFLVIAAAMLLVAGVAYLIRQRRGPSASRGSLETVATVVGILGGVAGLAVQFVPGVGAQKAPAPAATMIVRDVNARIPRLEYARKVDSERPRGEDRHEVGNVIWLEIHLEGYRDKEPRLQYALYDPGAGGALLPGTAVVAPLPHSEEDVETQFVPVWVGYPLSEKFRASFRLLDGTRVQAVAETNDMKASKYRYSC